jgi:PKD repeat protein
VEAGWIFADGSAATGTEVSHTFRRTGSYQVRAVAQDEEGEALEASIRILATSGGAITGAPDRCGTPCGFTVQAAGPRCEWDFGDGGKALSCTAPHTYDRKGPYQIRLKIFDESSNLVVEEAWHVQVMASSQGVPGPGWLSLAAALLGAALLRRSRR